MNEMQFKLLEMFKWLDRFLRSNQIPYYVIGGTMLGAVRHHGFIPWDDDIDIAVPRNEYEKLIHLLKEKTEHYIIESATTRKKGFIYNFAKFYDTNTSMTELARHNVKRGLFIDVFPLDGIGNNIDEALMNYKRIDNYNMLLAMKCCKYRSDRAWWKNILLFFGRMLPVSVDWLLDRIDLECKKHSFENCNYVGNLVSTYRSREIMKKEFFGTPTEYQFEDITVFGPEKYEEYLSQLFHDWRQIPPENQRHPAHDFIDLDYNTPYLT